MNFSNDETPGGSPPPAYQKQPGMPPTATAVASRWWKPVIWVLTGSALVGVGWVASSWHEKSPGNGQAKEHAGLEGSEVAQRIPTYAEASAAARSLYLADETLRNDPDWNEGNLPESSIQRLAILKRIEARHPESVVIQIEIAKAMDDDGDSDASLKKFVTIHQAHPENRLALEGIDKGPIAQKEKIPFARASLQADPLNFRARQVLITAHQYENDYLSAWLESQRALEGAPYSLELAEESAENYLKTIMAGQLGTTSPANYESHAAVAQRMFEEALRLRKVINLAAAVLAERTPESIDHFIAEATRNSDLALPYACELVFLGSFERGLMHTAMKGKPTRAIETLIQRTRETHPLLAESYLSDPASVIYEHGLLLDAMHRQNFNNRSMTPLPDTPIDLIAMLWLVSGGASSESNSLKPWDVVKWKEIMEEDLKYRNQLSSHCNEVFEKQVESRSVSELFMFFLAHEKDRLEKDFHTNGPDRDKAATALERLRDVPSRRDALDTLKGAINTTGAERYWSYYGDSIGAPVQAAFRRVERER